MFISITFQVEDFFITYSISAEAKKQNCQIKCVTVWDAVCK